VFRGSLAPGEYIIGREPTADIVLSDSSVSIYHAKLSLTKESVVIEDLGSENGTWIDGKPIQGSSWLYTRNTVQLGSVILSATLDPLLSLVETASPYTVGELIRSGGMGAILEARQTTLGRKVAMKVMLRPEDDAAVCRFVNEARITGVLEHPNIIPVHDLGAREDGQLYYTMKFVRGRTLAEVITSLRTVSPTASSALLASLLTTFQKVCDAVAFAHHQGVFHRDLKPDNIMIGDYGEVLVMDWGLAREQVAGSYATGSADKIERGHTMAGSVLGTPEYMSPEQAQGDNARVNQLSDIYSLGAILHELLYLKPPITSSDPLRVIDKVARGVRDPIGAGRYPHLPGQRVPAALTAVARKATSLDPSARYQSVKELQRDVEAYQNGFATAAQEAGLITILTLFLRRHRGASIAGLAGVSAVLGAWGFFTTKVVHERNRAIAAETHATRERDRAVEAEKRAEENLAEANAAKERAISANEEAERRRMEAEAQRKIAQEERDTSEKERARSETLLQNAREALMEADRVVEILNRLSDEYIDSGRIQDGVASLDRALALVPKNQELMLRRANLLQASGRFQDAIPAYREILELGSSPSAQENLSLTERLQNAKDSASGMTEEIKQELQSALQAQGRAREILALEAVPLGPDAPPEEQAKVRAANDVDVATALKRLDACTKFPGWSNDRVRKLADGTLGIDLSNLGLKTLSALRDLPVSELNLNGNPIGDLSSVSGLKLRRIDFMNTEVADLKPLAGMPLEHVDTSPRVTDLRPLAGMPLRFLRLWNAQIDDFGSLKGMHLDFLDVGSSHAKDLSALEGMPLRSLWADRSQIKDLKAIGSLTSLEVLGLPGDASGIDLSKLKSLREVLCFRFSPDQIPGAQFREMFVQAEAAWKKWSGQLLKLRGRNIGPHCISVSNPEGFELSLEGTGISELGPLAEVPMQALRLDRLDLPIDLEPLRNHPTLRRLVLSDSNVSQIKPLLDVKLDVIVAAASIRDIALLAAHPSLQFLGYQPDRRRWSTETTREEFFGPRNPPSDIPPDAVARVEFDDPSDATQGWLSMSGNFPSPAAWIADPTVERGRGGGAFWSGVSVTAKEPISLAAPDAFLKALPKGKNGALIFDQRLILPMGYSQPLQVILRSNSLRLVRQINDLPTRTWNRQVIPLAADGEWRLNNVSGRPANPEEFESVLANPKALLLQMSSGDGPVSPTAVDDIAVLRPVDASDSLQRLADSSQSLMALREWLAQVKVVTSKEQIEIAVNFASANGLDVTKVGEFYALKGFQDRGPVLWFHPPDRQTPSVIEIPHDKIKNGSVLRFAAKGMESPLGVRIEIRQGKSRLLSKSIGNEWTEIALPLSDAAKAKDPIVIEIFPDGWNNEACFIEPIRIEQFRGGNP